MKTFLTIITYILLLIGFSVSAQEGFVIDKNNNKFSLPYQSVNNLSIIPVTLNGVELSFLLDTGVEHTILFSLDGDDSLEVKNTSLIYLKGMGKEQPLKALKSTGNQMKIGDAVNENISVYVIFDFEMDLSYRMGVPIHGIIGYDFFKQFVVELNHNKSKLRVYLPETYSYKECKKCEDFDIVLQRNKPYVELLTLLDKNNDIPLNFLIDSGLSDAVWLFSKKKSIEIPSNAFQDHLGYTLSGSVNGWRSRISQLKIGKFHLEEVAASFPDTSYSNGSNFSEDRDGIIGAQILKRFKVTVDYSNKKIRLKPNKYFVEAFEYDMSGIVVAHEGYTVIETVEGTVKRGSEKNLLEREMPRIKYSLKPQYQIVEIRPNSPAERAGVELGDTILAINGKKVYKLNLFQIMSLLKAGDGKRIKLLIERKGKAHKLFFNLEKIV